jgi:hypothetical protein
MVILNQGEAINAIFGHGEMAGHVGDAAKKGLSKKPSTL